MPIYNPGRFKMVTKTGFSPLSGASLPEFISIGPILAQDRKSGQVPRGDSFPSPGESILIRFDVAKGNPGLGMGKK